MYDWDAIRQEACRLYYDQGLSLTALKVELGKRKRDVSEAHDRTWRLKLKRWGAKRPRVTTVASSRQPDGSSLARQDVDDEQDGLDSGRGATTPIALVDTTTPMFADAPTPWPLVAHWREHISHACICCAAELDGAAHEMFNLVHSGCVRIPGNLIDRCVQGPDSDNILHLFARDVKWAHMERFTDAIRLALGPPYGIHVDALDCDGRTALEISIKSDNFAIMNVLAEQRASLSRCNSDGQTALAVALNWSENVSLIANLLERTLAAGLLLDDIDDTAEVLLSDGALVNIDKILRADDPEERQIAWRVVEYVVLQSNRSQLFSWQSQLLLRTMLECSRHRVWDRKQAREVIWKLFLSYTGPPDDVLRWDDGLDWRCDCHTAAEFAIIHLADPEINDVVIDQASDFPLLLSSLIRPCTARAAACDVNYLADILERTISSWIDIDDAHKHAVLEGILCWSPADVKLPYWKSVVGSDKLDIHRFFVGYGRDTLAKEFANDENFDGMDAIRLKLAEEILPHDPGFPGTSASQPKPVFFSSDASVPYLYYSSGAYLDHLYHWSTGSCQVSNDLLPCCLWTCSALQTCGCSSIANTVVSSGEGRSETAIIPSQRQSYRAIAMHRCVIHVITTDLCKAESLFAGDTPLETRVRDALQLRTQFKLPDLVIEPSTILQMLNGCYDSEQNTRRTDEDDRLG